MLPLVLALTTVPSYVGCSSYDARFRLLGPVGEEVAPTNTAIWLLEQLAAPSNGRPQLVDMESGDAIDAVELTTPLRSGLLIELRPTTDLLPSHRYAIQIPGSDPIEVTTDLGPDRIRPSMPDAMESEETPPLAHCQRSSAILIHTETSEMRPFLLATTRDGDVAIARDEDLIVPASEGEKLSLSVVLMDLAGNRSPPSVPIDASVGCQCVRGQASFLSLLPILLIAKRRKR
jgi:hypothetical protein